MKSLLSTLAAAILTAGCASQPQATQTADTGARDCRNVDAPTGSRLVRKADCPLAEPATVTK